MPLVLTRVFELFTKGSASRGSGLGLAKMTKTLMPTTTIVSSGTTITLFADPEGTVTGLVKTGG